jgi:hypothetical protein
VAEMNDGFVKAGIDYTSLYYDLFVISNNDFGFSDRQAKGVLNLFNARYI